MQELQARGPQRPGNIDPLAVAVLDAFRLEPESGNVILGGHFALKHYLDYRATYDVDGWWPADIEARALEATRESLWRTVAEVGDANGLEPVRKLRSRVESYELRKVVDGRAPRTIFSVQIAHRSIVLDDPIASPWAPIKIETLRENIASKMNALVNRGAPRDFIDIYMLVQRGVVTVDGCWELWQMKRPNAERGPAEMQVLQFLSAIDMRRPLVDMAPDRRENAARTRAFFRDEFTNRDRGHDRPAGPAAGRGDDFER